LKTRKAILNKTFSDKYDTPWKTVLEKYFQLLLEFLFPRIAQEIDWDKPPVHLDKELLVIQKKSKIGKRIADKVIDFIPKEEILSQSKNPIAKSYKLI
jgi:hypothetical protein